MYHVATLAEERGRGHHGGCHGAAAGAQAPRLPGVSKFTLLGCQLGGFDFYNQCSVSVLGRFCGDTRRAKPSNRSASQTGIC